jgi:tetratricopeptide (TPR) repeat protein
LFNNPAAISSTESTLAAAGPRYRVFYFDLAEAQRRAGLMGSAIESYRRMPESARALAALGDALLRVGETAQAITVLEKARRFEPENAANLQILGVAYGASGHEDRALKTLRRAVELDPDLVAAWVNLGVALEATGDRENADKSYVEAIRLQPDSAEARHRLATLRARK